MDDLIKQADSKLAEIRKLGAKPEQRWFGVGPKKSLTKQDKLRARELSNNEVSLRSQGMQKKRLASGLTKMVRGKEAKAR